MCGLVGIVGEGMTAKETQLFRSLMVLAQFRGDDSSGIFQLPRKTNKIEKALRKGHSLRTEFVKSADCSSWFLGAKNVENFLKNPNEKLGLIGHTRAATIGTVSADNAHPFEFDHVIGVMNGTIPKYLLPQEYDKGYETDSEGVFAMIEDAGAEEALKELCNLRNAPFAMVFFDRRTMTLNFIRNETNKETRPLHAVISEDGKRLIWASEMAMINFAVARQAYKLKLDEGVLTPKIRVLYRYPVYEQNWLDKCEMIPIPLVAKPAPPPATSVPSVKVYSGESGLPFDEDESDPFGADYGGDDVPDGYYEEFQDGRWTKKKSNLTTGTGTSGVSTYPDLAPVALKHGPQRDELDIPPALRRTDPTHLKASLVDWGKWADVEPGKQPPVGAIDPDRERTKSNDKKPSFQSAIIPAEEEREDSAAASRVYYGPGGVLVSGDTFRRMVRSGCSCCPDGVIDPMEEGVDLKIGWIASDIGPQPVCELCTKADYLQDVLEKPRGKAN